MTKVVKTQSKGMVTIPVEFRTKLGIQANSLLEVKLVEDRIVFAKLAYKSPKVELYSDQEMKEWLALDQIDPKTAQKLKKLLKNK